MEHCILGHIPKRKCIGCFRINSKVSLIRLVKDHSCWKIDQFQKFQSRGYYLCKSDKCWEKTKKNKKFSFFSKLNTEIEEYFTNLSI